MSTLTVEQADLGSVWQGGRSPLDRSGLFTRLQRDRHSQGELTTPASGYPWSDAARQGARAAVERVQDRVDAVLARQEGQAIKVYAIFKNEDYDHEVVRAFAELEVRLRDGLGTRYGRVEVETLPRWAVDPTEYEAIKLRAVTLA